jgi:hypothetical protein
VAEIRKVAKNPTQAPAKVLDDLVASPRSTAKDLIAASLGTRTIS